MITSYFKRLFSLFLFLIGGLTAQDYSIVFIHIGKEIPLYLEDAVAQARSFNSDCDIILIANETAIDVHKSLFPDNTLTYISCESLQKSPEHFQFLSTTQSDIHSRDGFWRYTSECFLYLYDFMEQYQMFNVFHLEYDNMLYADLGELLPIFENLYPGIAGTFDNDQRCIPGFVYASSPSAMKSLSACFASSASKSLNDMEVLALFKNTHSPNEIYHLPILTREYAASFPLVSPFGHTVKSKNPYFFGIDFFHSIFDAAALGQFLGGIDPRNGPSIPGFINESCVFNPALLTIEWLSDEQNRLVPYLLDNGNLYRINNLHVHSKELQKFSSNRNKQY